MDVQTAKSAIIRELGNRIAVSGGPEVFRRLVGGQVDVVQGALSELVKEGLLKETTLRVGTIYHYPPNVKSSLGVMNTALSGGPVARPARPAAGRAAAPTPARPAAPVAARPAGPPAGGYTGPMRARKKSQMTPEELAAAAAATAARAASAAPAAAVPTAAPVAPAGPVAYTGPVRARKKSQMSPEELAA
ncbi:MAG TPA: hypothetical protein VK689_16655, partial [Armatimonadota bacterium]|nr:hypothetical protein [Armatimonadota bacterium]